MSFIYSKTSWCTLEIKYILRTHNGRQKRLADRYTEVEPFGSFFRQANGSHEPVWNQSVRRPGVPPGRAFGRGSFPRAKSYPVRPTHQDLHPFGGPASA